MFRKTGIGPLVGKRTWGGLVGIYDYRHSSTAVSSPHAAGILEPDGTWDVENAGVTPDIEWSRILRRYEKGTITLEKAVEVVMEALKKNRRRNTPPSFSELLLKIAVGGTGFEPGVRCVQDRCYVLTERP